MASAALFESEQVGLNGFGFGSGYEDPLDCDRSGDVALIASRRALCRVALIAAETAARFTREAQPHDAMAWMLAPRRLFGGAAAIDACLERDNCERALVLHGLSLGMDAEPSQIDDLRPDDDGEARHGVGDQVNRDARPVADYTGDRIGRHLELELATVVPIDSARDSAARAAATIGSDDASPLPTRRLHSATIAIKQPGLDVIAFHASFARDYREVFERLVDRFGVELAGHAEVRKGFDAGHPLLPAEVTKLLLRAIAEGGDSGEQIDVTFERRTVA